jgi:tRNA/rRNA methyltransferase
MAELDGMIGQLDAALDHAGYYYPPDKTPSTRNTIRTIMSKPGWSSREVKAVRGMIRTLVHPRPR